MKAMIKLLKMPFVITRPVYQIKTDEQRGRNSKEQPHQSLRAILSSTKPKKPQLQSWLEKTETHEQMMVGQKTSRSFAKTMHLIEATESILREDFK